MTADPAGDDPVTGQRLLIPAYFYPRGDRWQEMCDALEQRGIQAVIIMNPASGPGAATDPVYRAVLDDCLARRQIVIGYVDTDYRRRKPALVRCDIERFYELYPGIGGIFLDQVSNESGRNVKASYRRLYRWIKELRPDALVVANPGVPALSAWQVRGRGIADVLCVCEMPAEEYSSWAPPAWVAERDPSGFAHLIYATSGAAETAAVCTASQSKNAGWLYVTQGVMPNPWDRPPEAALYAHPGLAQPVALAT